MSASDARVRQDCGAISAETILADTAAFTTCSILSGTNNADVAPTRIVNLGSGAGGLDTLTSPLIPSLTAGSVLFAQQKSSGAVVTPVAAITVPSGLGFAVQLVAAAPMAANTNYWVYIAEY
jgi:hypothetical protein